MAVAWPWRIADERRSKRPRPVHGIIFVNHSQSMADDRRLISFLSTLDLKMVISALDVFSHNFGLWDHVGVSRGNEKDAGVQPRRKEPEGQLFSLSVGTLDEDIRESREQK